jgi:GAF domain-containing protein
MIKPLFTANEFERLQSLFSHDFESLENCYEFDFLTELSAQVCGCPISLISQVYNVKKWFLSHHDLDVKEISRDFSFCVHAIHNPELEFVLKNTLNDERFFDNLVVVGEPKISFYFGIPI